MLQIKRDASMLSYLGSQVTDLSVTCWVVTIAGVQYEVNPFGRGLMSLFSPIAAIYIAKLWTISWGWFLYRVNFPKVLLGLSFVYFAALIAGCFLHWNSPFF